MTYYGNHNADDDTEDDADMSEFKVYFMAPDHTGVETVRAVDSNEAERIVTDDRPEVVTDGVEFAGV